MARLNICLLVVLMALSVCCDVVEEFSATEKDEGFTPADQYDQLQDEGISAAEMFEKLSAAADDKGVSPADQEDERSAKENDEGFSAAEKDMKFTAVENGDGVSVADEYDRGQCSANKDSQCSSGEEEKVGKRKVKSLYEMFEEGEGG